VALHFADRSKPCVILDKARQIRLFSAALEQLLGWERDKVEGRVWDEVIAPRAHAEIAKSRIERALAGTQRTFESEALSADGRRFLLSLDASLVGRDDEQGVLLTVTSARAIETTAADEAADEIDYEVISSVSQFGQLISMRVAGRAPMTSFSATDRCHLVIRNQPVPCSDCPLLRSAEGWPRTTARRLHGARPVYEVITANAVDDRVCVRLRRISEETIGAIQESRVRDLAERARLSERERAVLTYLLMGRSLADIGTILNISARTVKFHQTNILEKLGADSRTDLIRLVT
jgi:PAS domain S-box-containing protein